VTSELLYLLGKNEFLAGNAKNIACSLQRITTFISQRLLGNKDNHKIITKGHLLIVIGDLIL